MKIAILGTGMVARSHGAKLFSLGHEVVMGTSNVEEALTQNEPDSMGNPPLRLWLQEFTATETALEIMQLMQAAQQGEIVINALKGEVSLSVLKSLHGQLSGKILVDISNPLDFSLGMPPTLFVSNTDSLGEQIQRALPDTKVVKVFNTVNASLQVNPVQLADGDHHLFLSGNDAQAKEVVLGIAQSYGWKNVLDLGNITTARGTEMFLPLWLRMWGAIGNTLFNIKVIKE